MKPKTCIVCRAKWVPKDRAQARNKTCSRACLGKLLSEGQKKPQVFDPCQRCDKPILRRGRKPRVYWA